MTPPQAPSAATDLRNRPAWLDVLGYALTGLAWAAAEWFVLERGAYRSLLGLGESALHGDERWLVPLVVIGNGVSFVLPALLLGAALAFGKRRRSGLAGYLVLGAAGCVLVSLDLRVYVELGRHLVELAHFMALPKGYQAVGDTSAWIWAALWTSLGLTAGFVLFALACQKAIHAALAKASRGFVQSLTGVSVAAALLCGIGAPALGAGYSHSVVMERVYSSLPFDLRPAGGRSKLSDPALAHLANALDERYRRAFPRLIAQHPLPPDLPLAGGPHPSVVIIVLESWRSDALDAEKMPRLDAWSKAGMRLERHYAGSDYSEAGMFALLYGRSPLVYHAALDAKLSPDLCDVARRAGYTTAYFSGQPLDWVRQEEFINPSTFDRFEHDDAGSWIDWDRKALTRAVLAAREPARPVLAVVYLMSSHFEYRYPPEYERHLPVDQKVRFETTRMASLGAEARVGLTNRYDNALGFLDDLIADSLEKLDLSRTVVVVTGDHGESLGDDGRFGHGYGFPEIVARTPMFLRGPGIASEVVRSPTLHVDLLPTLVHLLAGRALALPEADGVDLLARGAPRASLLLGHCGFERSTADALLLSGTRRLRLELGLRAADVTLEGFEDPLGHLLPYESVTKEVSDALVSDFDHALLIIGGSGGS